jgi:hypothetical protein
MPKIFGIWVKECKGRPFRYYKEEGWNDVAKELERAFEAMPDPGDRFKAEFNVDFSKWQEKGLTKALGKWIVEHAQHLSFFTVWQG